MSSEARASGTGTGTIILEGRDLEKTYDMGDRGLRVLRGVSVEVKRGEVLAIQGPSGAGKSTLLHLLGLLDEPDRGAVLYHGTDLISAPAAERARYRNEKIGFVFQFYHLFPDLSALENVCLPKMVKLSWLEYRAGRAAIRWRAEELLVRVGLKERMAHLPSELSGGERQRVAIARALMNEPEVLLCDEPTGNLDQKTASEILDVLWKLNRESGQTFVIVTHDENLARRADRVVRVVDGVVADGGPAKPRGFEETKFRLRGGAPPRRAIDRPLILALLLLLSFAIAVFAIAKELAPGFAGISFAVLCVVWMVRLHARFWRATRRGWAGWIAGVVLVVPLAGHIFSLFMHVRPLRDANRLLRANGEPPLAGWWGPCVLWPIAWLDLTVAPLFAWALPPVQSRDVVLTLLLGAVLFAVSAAWIQSLHNRFYDTMRD